MNLNKHYRETRSVSFYAQKANLSAGHFSALIRSKTGRSPQHWITYITINRAKGLLRNKELSIKEIADSLGFPEQFSFRKYFKLYVGVSPTEWRKGEENL